MTPSPTIRHAFVECVPDKLEEGVLYISVVYSTTAHKCFCGCGSEVVAPLRPNEWHLIFDGETVSLKPSIGNWSFACQSHYWINRDRVCWAPRWTREEIDQARAKDGEANTPREVLHRQGEVPTSDRSFWQVLRQGSLFEEATLDNGLGEAQQDNPPPDPAFVTKHTERCRRPPSRLTAWPLARRPAFRRARRGLGTSD